MTDQPRGPAPRPGPSRDVTRTIPLPAGPPDQTPPADRPVPGHVDALRRRLAGRFVALAFWVGDWTVILDASALPDAAGWLRHDPAAAFDQVADITATDWPARDPRFDVVYCLGSTTRHHRLRLKARLADGAAVPSVTRVWPAANWLEREVYDMFGIRFDGHPDLRRILMPDDWQGHPERKDYPLEGPGELLIESPTEWLRLARRDDLE